MYTENNIEEIIKPFWFKNISEFYIEKCFHFLDDYYFRNKNIDNIKLEFEKFKSEHNFDTIVKFGSLLIIYKLGRIRNYYSISNIELEEKLKVQNVIKNYGVMVFNIFTSPLSKLLNNFEVLHKIKCVYFLESPKDPNIQQSYIVDKSDFYPMKQILDRGLQYIQQGHPINKIEVIIQGDTWDSYSIEYRTEFIRDIYWTFNIFMDWLFYDKQSNDFDKQSDIFFQYKNKKIRQKKSLDEEIKINETVYCRVIGLTIETIPCKINYNSIKFLRKIGATKVQLGVQHIDDYILIFNNQNCYKKDTFRAIKILKDNGFKISIHLMLDLPYPKEYENKMILIDRKMLEEFNNSSNLKIDHLKIYSFVVTPYTKIQEWYDQGIYKPYRETIKIDKNIWKSMNCIEKNNFRLSNPLYKTIFNFLQNVHLSIRVERINIDIPANINDITTQNCIRSEIDQDMKILGIRSNDIRSREVCNTNNIFDKPIILKEEVFSSSDGTEYFLSFETDEINSILYSLLRLRLSSNSGKTLNGKIIFPELVDCALIRELYTYGKVQPCKQNKKYYKNNALYKGFGKKLLFRAEEIAKNNGYKKIAVISGVGFREYYRNNGYTIDSKEGCYLNTGINSFSITHKYV